jgi:hypothetical protein
MNVELWLLSYNYLPKIRKGSLTRVAWQLSPCQVNLEMKMIANTL